MDYVYKKFHVRQRDVWEGEVVLLKQKRACAKEVRECSVQRLHALQTGPFIEWVRESERWLRVGADMLE